MTRRLNGALALAVLVLAAVVVSASFAATSATPGVTSKTITIGGTFPLTGPAALYGVIPKAEAAYFAYVNAHGGVNKRQIASKYYDDGYNPANTVPLTKKLVQQDHVFAVYGSLGTAPKLATRDYLNQNKVPQVLVATGDSYWGLQYKKYPWTIGFQPDYPGESRVYGQFIKNKVTQAKIGVLMQDDAYGQNYYNGLVAGPRCRQVEDRRRREVRRDTDGRQPAGREVEGARARTCSRCSRCRQQTITALVVATKIGWQPTTFISNVFLRRSSWGSRRRGARMSRATPRRPTCSTSTTIRTRRRPSSTRRSSRSTTRGGPARRERALRRRKRVDDGAGLEKAGEPHASRADERADAHEPEEPVPLSRASK